jgi:hypothetical protein
MSEKDLRNLIEYASNFAEGAMRLHGNVAPIWHMITSSGQEIVELTPQTENKDYAMAMIRALMEIEHVVRYVYFAEAWMLDFKNSDGRPSQEELDRIMEEGASQHPDRIECVVFQAEDNECGMLSGHRKIIRNGEHRPRLGPLEFMPRHTESTGRMVGLLPKPEGRLQ